MNYLKNLVLIEDIRKEQEYCNFTQEKICNDEHEIRDMCEKKCPIDCQDYEVNFFHTEIERENEQIFIKLDHSQDKHDQIIQHVPKWSMQEFLACLGGLAGPWIGLSLIDISEVILKNIFKLINNGLQRLG